MGAEAFTVVILVALLASVAQSVTAFGFALVSVPAMVFVLDVQDAVVVVSILALATEVLLAFRIWTDVRWRTVGRLLVGSWIGMPVGLLVLVRAPEEALRLMVGVVAVVLASAIAAGIRITARGAATEVVVGGAAGVLGTSTGMSGPPVVAYLVGRGDEKDEFRAVITMYFLIGSVTAVALFFAVGVVTRDALLLALAGLPAVYAGSVLGHWLASRIDAILFRRMVIGLLLATALSAIGFSIQRIVS